MKFSVSPHAARQAEVRKLTGAEIAQIVEDRMTAFDDAIAKTKSFAVLCGVTEDRGSLIGSNGDEVWAILREAMITTVMLRRSSQPKTPQALRVDYVIA